ncbi:MAG: hypothetical protein NVS3B20_09850 [Polyangiales bacterium]
MGKSSSEGHGEWLQGSPLILDAGDNTRARLLSRMSRHYSPVLHFLATLSIGFAALALALVEVSKPSLLEWAVVPLMFVVSNGVEWCAHKRLLHHRVKPLQELFDRHTPEHHAVFGYHDMAIRDVREWKLVLIPAVGVFSIVCVNAVLSLLVSQLWSRNAGFLMLATSAIYVVGYELSHLSYHLPEASVIGRLRWVRVLREQHRRHHHPGLMQRWNFNVTIPLFDWLMGTSVPNALVEATVRATAREERSL